MTAQTITPAERILELAAINQDVASMLKSAGLAVNVLAGRSPTSQTQDGEDVEMMEETNGTSLAPRKSAFEKQTLDYYTYLQAVIARLRRQAYALEEAGIISPEAAVLSSNPASQRQTQPAARGGAGAAPAAEPERITNGGLGNLDVGWLNSRGNRVGAEKEKEVVEQVKELLEKTLGKDDTGST